MLAGSRQIDRLKVLEVLEYMVYWRSASPVSIGIYLGLFDSVSIGRIYGIFLQSVTKGAALIQFADYIKQQGAFTQHEDGWPLFGILTPSRACLWHRGGICAQPRAWQRN